MLRLVLISILGVCLMVPTAVPAQEADLAALQRMIEALTARVEALEEARGEVAAPFAVVDEGGAEIFRISVVDGQPQLELGREGAVSLSAGIAGDTQAAKLVVGSEQAARIELALGERGVGGTLAIVDQAGVERIGLEATGSETTFSMFDPGSFGIFAVGAEGTEKPKLQMGTETGTRIEAGIEDDGAFLRFVDEGSIQRVALTTNEEVARIVLGEEAGARLQAGVNEGGDGAFLSLIDEANAERAFMMAGTDTAVVALADASNEEFFSARLVGDQAKMVLGREGKARLQAGVTTDGAGSYLSLVDTAEVERLHMTGDGEKTEFVIAGSDNEEQIALRLEDQVPRLVLGKAEGARLQAGVVAGGGGAFLSLIDIGNNERIAITARNSAALIELTDPNLHATLGSVDDGGQKAGLYLGREEIDLVTVKLTETGGTVRVSDPQGNVVAGMLADAERGGRFVATGPGGGTTLAALSGGTKGGQVSVFDSAGDLKAYMLANTGGEVSVADDTGTAVMTTGEIAPNLTIADPSGTPFVFVGSTTDGVGIVATGPAGNGAAGVLGSMFEAASSIQGKKGE